MSSSGMGLGGFVQPLLKQLRPTASQKSEKCLLTKKQHRPKHWQALQFHQAQKRLLRFVMLERTEAILSYREVICSITCGCVTCMCDLVFRWWWLAYMCDLVFRWWVNFPWNMLPLTACLIEWVRTMQVQCTSNMDMLVTRVYSTHGLSRALYIQIILSRISIYITSVGLTLPIKTLQRIIIFPNYLI